MRRIRTAMACCMTAGIPAFAQQTASAPPSDAVLLRGALERLSAELDRAIGIPRAVSLSACASVAVGAKACDGPAHFRVYSTTTADAGRVTRLAGENTRTQRQLNELTGAISDCAEETPPALALALANG